MRTCDTCGKRFEWEDSECPRCRAAKYALGEHWTDVSDWVEGVAQRAARDAVLRHEDEDRH